MAYSYIKISAAAGQTSVPFSFDYLSTTEIKVSINDIEITAWSLSSPNVVALNTPLAGGEVVEIERVTNLTTRAVDFSSGAVLTEEDLDLSAQQVFNAAQEAIDSTEKNLSLDYENNYDSKGRRITDVGDAVDPGDVITKRQLDYDYPAVETVADNMTDVNTVASNITDINTVEDNITDINTVAGNISSVNTVGTNITNVNKVAVIDTDVTDVANNETNINTVAGNETNINTVAGISSDVTSVASNETNINDVVSNETNINTVAGNNTNISTVAGISSDVTTVAGISSDVTDVANNLTDVSNFADVYLGAKASDPSTRNDGTALQAGDLYFNTTVDELRTYSGSQWVSGTAGTMAVQRFTGDGTTTAFTLSTAPSGENNTQVYVNGIYQQKDTYSVSGTSLTLTEAPQSDEEVEVVTISTLALGETDASLVSYTGSGTGAVAQTVQGKLGEFVSVKDFGAVGDGTTDDTAAIQAAIDHGASINKAIYYPAGVYMVTNLVHKSTEWFGESRRNTTIKAMAGGDTTYMVTSPNWLSSSIYASTPTGFHNLSLNGAGIVENTLALRAYFTKVKNCQISHATNTDFLISTDSRNGTALTGSTMVNNVIEDCWIGVDSGLPQYNLRVQDTAGKASDYHVVDCYFSGATGVALQTSTSAGWNIQGNHFYGAAISLSIAKQNIGTRIVDNYFENEVYFYSGGAGYPNVQFGPGNFCLDVFWAKFTNNGESPDQIISVGNVYRNEVRHDWYGSSKVFVSKSDTYRLADPFKFYSSGNGSGSSSGIMQIIDASIAGKRGLVSATFAGNGSNVLGFLPKPSNLSTSKRYATTGSEGWHFYKGVVSSSNKHEKQLITPTEAISQTITIPLLSGDEGIEVEISISQKQWHSGPQRTTFYRKYNVIKKASTGTYHFTRMLENYDAAEWSVNPTLNAVTNGDYTDITFTGTVSTTDGYGPLVMQVNGV